MAFIIKTIGPTGADFLTVSLWKADWDDLGNGQYHGKLIGNISDTTIMNSVSGTNIDVKITGDASGATRRKITASGAARILELNDSGVTTGNFTLEDIDLDGNGVATAGVANLDGWPTSITMKRVRITDITGNGLSGTFSTYTLENVIIDNCSGTGFSLSDAGTYTIKNCGAYKNAGRGYDIGTQASRTHTFSNCVAIGNGANVGFRLINGAAQRENHEGVSSDATATDSDWEVVDNCVINKSTTTDPVFVDFANDDFHKNESDNDSWGISGDSANTPALDLDGVTRINDTIGPLEFIAAGGFPLTTLNKKTGGKLVLSGGKQ